MNQYKIVYLQEKMIDIINTYPELVSLLYSKQNDIYETKQIELIFQPIHYGKEKLLNAIKNREDYSYFHGCHQLINPITEEKISIVMNEYDIEVVENEDKHVIFDIIKAYSKNFCMIRS